ncbi:MAG: dihydrofolate reductase [Bacteroidales bacterium]|nr:dihydrofolate reductase [Bacteroidales bacterium]
MKTEKPYVLSLIAVIGPKGELGANNDLLWHISEDLRHFKALTMGHTIIMGRKTFESLGKPLPGRNNVVLSRSGLTLEQALAQEKAQAADRAKTQAEVFIIGGAEVYRQAIDLADRLYITHVQAPLPEGGADVFFPEIDLSVWKETGREDQPRGATFPYPFSFVTYERRPK